MISLAIFLVFAALAVAAAVLVVVQKNAMHSVLYLALAVLATAGVFFTLQAEYLGAIQILVYGGGIVVLYIFVIIIVNLKEVLPEKRRLVPRLVLVAVPILLAAEIVFVVVGNKYRVAAGHEQGLDLASLGEMLLKTYLVPFEIASILLLAVLIGAIIIARKKSLHDPD
jgi:NADH-quinone oxidoreductase subunit J